jgi:hypothetical protein
LEKQGIEQRSRCLARRFTQSNDISAVLNSDEKLYTSGQAEEESVELVNSNHGQETDFIAAMQGMAWLLVRQSHHFTT